MRVILMAAIFGVCVAGAALAQTAVLDMSGLEWDDRPEDAFSRRYPPAAQEREIPGAAVVCCTVNAQRRLDCETAFEWPAGFGFGQATIAVMREYRLSQTSYEQLMASPDRNLPIRRTMRWLLPDRLTPETTAAFDRISVAAQNMCAAPIS
jgi:hypothetical protein